MYTGKCEDLLKAKEPEMKKITYGSGASFLSANRYGGPKFTQEDEIPIDDSPFWDPKDKIFVQIPKTGSLSVSYKLNDTRYGFGHLFASQYPERIRHKLITIVRNPYDRLVSAYYFMLRGGFHDNLEYAHIKKNYKNFEDWVLRGLTKELIKISFTQTLAHDYKGWMEPFLPQYYWVTDPGGQLIISKDNIGRFENLVPDVKRLLDIDLDLHLNMSKDKLDWRTYYTNKEVADKVYDLYQKDFHSFGYSKDFECAND